MLLLVLCLFSVGCTGKKGKGEAETSSSITTDVTATGDTTTGDTTSGGLTSTDTTTEPSGTTTEGQTTVIVPSTTVPTPPDDYSYEYSIDVSSYLSYLCPSDPTEYLILANRYHSIGSSYVPDDLIKISSTSNWHLREAAKMALDAMIKEMKVRGVYDSFAQSTYRSYYLQDKLYEKYLREEKALHPNLSQEELMAIVDTYSARPGTSDHQTGLAIDFYPINARFENYKMFAYLKDNAHKFGFILRFPEGKTYLTGYMYESWHWRFVGREAATYIYENDLTLEEYVAQVNGTPIETFPETTKIPTVTRPATTKPTTTEPPTTEPPTTTELSTTEPPTTEPPTTEPIVTEPAVTAPITTEPTTTEPVATEPITTEPPMTEPIVTEPPVTTPVVTAPSATEPIVTTPPVTEPITTEEMTTTPPVSEAITTEEATEAETTSPAVTEPPMTAPTVTAPAVTVPSVTEPTVTEPADTELAATVPTTTVPPTTEP